MDNDESKSYFLSCKSHRHVFVKYLFIYVKDNDRYSGIFKATCTLEHSLQIIVKGIAEKYFNVMAKNFASESNSITHSKKKRMSKTVSGNSNKIRKLQSEN